MTLACRPLFAALILSLATTTAHAAKKPTAPSKPAPPAACADFYAHVNQDWLAANPLPPGAQSYSRWDELNASAMQQVRALLTPGGVAPAGEASRLLADLVASFGATEAMDASARAASQPLLARINAIRKGKDIAPVISALHAAGVPVVFGFEALRDPETGQARATLYPAALGLPGPAYYDASVPELQGPLALYRSYLSAQLKNAGVEDAKLAEQAASAMALEQTLAVAMVGTTREDAATAQLGKSYPSLQLANFMQAQGAAPTTVSVQQPEFFRALDKLLVKPSIPQWQAYLRAQVMHSLAPAMGSDPRQPYLMALGIIPSTGIDQRDRIAALVQSEASELTSAAYQETYLSPAQAQRASVIAEAVRAAMGRAIDRATWLSADGKAASRTKLAAMQLTIARPPEPVSFVGLGMDRSNFATNLQSLRRWNRARTLARLTSAVWPAPVSQAQPTIGYQPSENRLYVTAAVLRSPVLTGTSDAADFGSLGALIAQQMSLAFADYTENDGRALAGRQTGLVAQYAAYPVTPTVKVNATRMLRQNAADLAAIELAWDALRDKGEPDAEARKTFFRSWASVWARQDNPEALAAAQALSAFAPARWRVNGPLVNTPEFAKAFACKAGQAMYKPEKEQLAIWR